MAETRPGLRNAPLWVYIPVSMVLFMAGWMVASVAINLTDGHPVAYELFRSLFIAVGAAAVLTVIRVAVRGSRR